MRVTILLQMILGVVLTVSGTILDSVEAIGPFNASQRSTSLLINSENSNNWFVGTNGGGLWVSNDAGVNWHQYDLLNRFGSDILDIEQDPTNPAIICYLSSGGYGDDQPNPGVYQSIDTGKTFTKLSGLLAPHSQFQAYNLFVYNGKVWITERSKGFYKVEQNGNYVKLYDGSSNLQSATMTIKNGTPYFFLGSKGNIIRLKETGEADTVLTKANQVFSVVGASHSSPQIIYVAFTNKTNKVKSIYRSDNYGTKGSWVLVKEVADNEYLGNKSSDIWMMDGYGEMCGLRVDPTNPELLFLMSTTSMLSEDGGKTWYTKRTSGDVAFGDMWPNAYRPVPNSSKLVLGHDHGLFEGELASFFDTSHIGWTKKIDTSLIVDKSKGMGTFTSYVGACFDTGKVVLTGGQDRGGWIIDGSNEYSAGGGDVYMVLVSPTRVHVFNKHGSSRIINSDHKGNFISSKKSSDTLITYQSRNQAGITNNGEIVYANDYSSSANGYKYLLVMSVDSGETFIPYFQGNKPIRSVATHPIARKSYFMEGKNLREFDHQTKLVSLLTDTLSNYDDIEMNDGDDSVIYLYSSSKIIEYDLRSKKGKSIFGNLPTSINDQAFKVFSIAGINRDTLFIGTNYGIYSTRNGGSSWEKETSFPDVRVYDVDIRLSDNKLFAFTYGLGAWYASIHSEGDDTNLESTLNRTSPIQFSVNLQNGKLKLNNVTGFNKKDLNISIVDSHGRVVFEQANLQKTEIDVSNIASGMYYIQLSDRKNALTHQIVIQ